MLERSFFEFDESDTRQDVSRIKGESEKQDGDDDVAGGWLASDLS